MLVNEIKVEGKRVILTWTDSKSHKGINPITQAWAFCFNSRGEMLLCRKSKEQNWLLPGGTIEKGETPEETLHREADEEASITLNKIKLLGYQKAEFPEGKNELTQKTFPLSKESEALYQLRYFAMIKDMKQLTPDPDSGFIFELKFIKPEEFTKYLKWGNIGEHLAKRAKEFFEEQKKLK